ncbi:MAG TPA: ATP-binding protein [Bryobacteraceae bacterium]|jgi:signal transduction histidine kinase
MAQEQITQRNIFRALLGGLSLMILLLVAASVAGVRNIQSIQSNAGELVREQALSNRLIGELQDQERNVSDVFSVLARDPESVDYDGIMSQLDEADRDIKRISAQGESTPERTLWEGLQRASLDFSAEARRLLNDEAAETYATIDLFRDHEAFVSIVARLLGVEYGKVSAAQAQIDRRSSRLLETSIVFASTVLLLGLIFAIATVRAVSSLTHKMERQTAELGRVSWHMLENQEATARRFSHELHDELGQSLTAIKTNLAALEMNGRPTPERLNDCLRLVDEAIGNVRQMSQLLRPTILDDFGLEAGLRWLADGFSARTSIAVDLESHFSGRLPDETETHLFRIAQEALTNVARHSGASRVHLLLDRLDSQVQLSISDDGCGLPITPAGSIVSGAGLGMTGMRARARSIGGDLTIRSRPNGGVRIEVRAPVFSPPRYEDTEKSEIKV